MFIVNPPSSVQQLTTAVSDVQIEECPYDNFKKSPEKQPDPAEECLSKGYIASFGPHGEDLVVPVRESSVRSSGN